jgi:protein-disulfide isomerase
MWRRLLSARRASEFTVCFLATLCVFSIGLNGVLLVELRHPEYWKDLRLSYKLPPPVMALDHIRGSSIPTVTVIEYSDYQCPYSKQLHSALSKIVQQSTTIRWILRFRPLESIHPLAVSAATAAECAGRQGRFWEYSDLLFDNQEIVKASGGSIFTDLALKLKLEIPSFDLCRSGSTNEFVKEQISIADKLEIFSTPTFFINGRRVTGLISESQLTQLLQR